MTATEDTYAAEALTADTFAGGVVASAPSIPPLGNMSARDRVIIWLTSPRLRIGALTIIVVAAVLIGTRTEAFTVDGLRVGFEGLGWLGPLLFAATYALAATFLLPAAPFTIAAGFLFGPALGTITALGGATAGATGAFVLGRLLGRNAVERLAGQRVGRIDVALSRNGFTTVVLVRLVPLLPFNLVSVTAGVTGIRLRDYVLATAVGIVPGTIAYAAIGGTITEPTSPAFLAAVAFFIVVTATVGIVARRMRRQTNAH